MSKKSFSKSLNLIVCAGFILGGTILLMNPVHAAAAINCMLFYKDGGHSYVNDFACEKGNDVARTTLTSWGSGTGYSAYYWNKRCNEIYAKCKNKCAASPWFRAVGCGS